MRIRESVLRRDRYLCVACLAAGRPTPATQVDHVIPLSAGGTDAMDNLQSLCDACHEAKTRRDMGYRERLAFGVDGMPVVSRP